MLLLSCGGPNNIDVVTKCLEKLNNKTIIVDAAGNSGNNDSVDHPARLPNVISVSSLDENFKPPGFSAENQHVNTYDYGKVFAPCKIELVLC